MEKLIGTYGGWVVAAAAAVFTFINQRRKTDVDESAIVLGEWKKLIEAHQGQIKSLVEEIADLRKRLIRAEDRITALEDENRSLRRENEGLVRQVAQKSQSQVAMLEPSSRANAPITKRKFGVSDPDADLIDKLDRKD